MEVYSCRRGRGLVRCASWLAAVGMAGVLLSVPAAYAAAPPANTIIGNQASGAYLDASGVSRTVTSNMVQTTVQQVGAFTLDSVAQTTTTVVNTKTGSAGATIYAPHVLTNTGNGSDTFTLTVATPGPNGSGSFSKVEVYADPTMSGLPASTTPLCSVTPSATCTVSAQTVAGNGGQFGFVVAYTLPSTATTPTTPYASATVTATPGTVSMYTSPNTTAADVDNVNLTTVAAFNLTKALAAPSSGVTAPGGGSWPEAPVSGVRSSSSSCATTWTAGMASSSTCQYTVYTLTYSNTGGATGRFNLRDTIGTGVTAGYTYVTGSTVWSNNPGSALSESGTSLPSGVDFSVSGGVMTFVDNSLPVSATRSLSFVVLVNSSAAVGTTSTSNTATYNPTDASGATAASPVGVATSTSNASTFTVAATYGVALGSSSSTATTALDSTAGTPNGTSAAGVDTTVVASAAQGEAVAFTQVVYNTGNTADSVAITSASAGTGGATAFPSGTTFAYFKADGSTPLNYVNGVYQTDSIAAGSSSSIVVKAYLPGAATIGSSLGYTLTVTATSVGDSTKVDATRNVLTAVTGSLLDLTNSAAGTSSGTEADLGVGPSTAPTTTNTVAAGSPTVFSLFIKNNDSVANTYTLASSATSSFPGPLPTGWTVKFVAGSVTASSCASATGITTTSSIAAGAQSQFTACVTPPASQVAVTAQPIYFQAVSVSSGSTGVTLTDTKYDAVTVTAAASTYSATLLSAQSGSVAAGGSVVYAHTLTNTGTGSCVGPYTITASLPSADTTAGWTTAIYLDANSSGTLDSSDTLVTGSIAGPLASGGTQGILIKVFAPGGAAVGATDTATVTVTFPSGTTSCGSPSTTDTSTVISGDIRLVKTQALDTACNGTVGTQNAAAITSAKPGQCIVYQVVATNQGTASVTNLIINDSIPSYTSLNATQPTTTCTSTGITTALTNSNFSSSSSSVSCGSSSNTVIPGGTATMTFEVKLNQ